MRALFGYLWARRFGSGKKIIRPSLVLCAVLYMTSCHIGHAAQPSHFEQVIGNAALCQDAIDPAWFSEYLTRFFRKPYKTWGGADWWRLRDTYLFTLQVEESFVNTDRTRPDFIGVVFRARLADVKDAITKNRGTRFIVLKRIPASPAAVKRGEDIVWRSTLGAHLYAYGPKKTKLVCVKYRVGKTLGELP